MSTIYFEGLTAGAVERGLPLVADRDEMLAYRGAFDPWPFHVDELAAAASPFGGLIASGGYAFGLLLRSIHAMYDRPDRASAFLGALE
jgi:acyl dehydratase